jgi:photosystem II stability/assembly factor-like uncharacterized protein
MTSSSKSISLLITVILVVLLIGCAKDTGSTATLPPLEETAVTPSEPSKQAASSPAETTAETSPSPSKHASLGKVTALRLASFQTGWAGGEGWIARTDDGGKSWTTQLQHKYIVTQLFALNKLQAWATLDIGDSKKLQMLHTSDGGKHWTETGDVPNKGFLHFVSEKEAFSGNARTTDGGKSWSTLSVPELIVGDAYFHDRNNGWSVTQDKDNFGISRTTDGGKSWQTVMSKETTDPVTGSIIRSAGNNDAWIELFGDSGMTQTSYSLFHTVDGGTSWQPVLANSGAGSGPAPGYEMGKEATVPANTGNSPGMLYVVNPKAAFMGGQCLACDNPNTLGSTTDGGKTWVNLKSEFPGYGQQLIAAADADHIWWINTDSTEPSVMYTSADGGQKWIKTYTFDKPSSS